MKECNILVSIDVIFDTLLGCVESINSEWANKLKSNKDYYTRKSNKLSLIVPEIDDESVIDKWQNRDINVLRKSKGTNLLTLLSDHASISNRGDQEHPEAIDMAITLNVYPYKLSTEEIKELFIILKSILGIKKLFYINKSLKGISPKFLRKKYNQFIIYDLNDWTGYHLDNLAKNPIPQITCTAPMCYLKTKAESGNIEGITQGVVSAYIRHLDIELLPLFDMSIDIDANN